MIHYVTIRYFFKHINLHKKRQTNDTYLFMYLNMRDDPLNSEIGC